MKINFEVQLFSELSGAKGSGLFGINDGFVAPVAESKGWLCASRCYPPHSIGGLVSDFPYLGSVAAFV